MSHDIFFVMAKGVTVSTDKSEVLQGTLDMMILKTLHALGPLHGFGIARRIEQVSEDVERGHCIHLFTEAATQGWIDSEWDHRKTTARPGSTRLPGGG
jgi:PadR family transcriptional regulator PadR